MDTQPSPQADAYPSFEQTTTRGDELNATTFLIEQMLAKVWTMIPVKVIAVEQPATTTTPAVVSIQPLVHQINDAGQATAHGVIHGVPCFRNQAGSCAFIVDPAANDLGLAVFAMRDISAAVASKAPNTPGSRRWFDASDAIYLGGFLGATTTEYVSVDPTSGVKITSTKAVSISAPSATITCPTITMSASTSVAITAPTLTASVSGSATITGSTVTIAGGGKAIARDGDPVVGGVVKASSTKAFSG